MKVQIDNFIDIVSAPHGQANSNENINENGSCKDPLALELDVKEHNYYKLNCQVFAEPMKATYSENNCNNADEMKYIGNVIIQKKAERKNKKYIIDVEDPSNPLCPQPSCSRSFASMTLLRAHIRKVHCSEHKFICEVCGARFKAQYLLKRHQSTHKMETVECHVCKKMLSKRTNLSLHLGTHSAARAHPCGLCASEFVRRAALNAHLQFVHASAPLACRHCPAKFQSRAEWNRHRSSHSTRKRNL